MTDREKAKTVISASRRTDIPAFYHDFLQGSLERGFIEVPNPMFPNMKYLVDLRPSSVHSIVLWSKDFSNVLKEPGHLADYNLYFQYTVNNYSRLLEPYVPEYESTIRTIDGLLKRYRPEQFNIRFDPVIVSLKGEMCPTCEMPSKARILAFERLCRDLRALGMDNCRISTSYIAMYKHVKHIIDKAGIGFVYLNEPDMISLFAEMAGIAQKFGMSLFSCASPLLEQTNSINKGHCIDGNLLERLFGGKTRKSKDASQRIACGCTYSRDIGIYGSDGNGMKCRHGCIYCYAKGCP